MEKVKLLTEYTNDVQTVLSEQSEDKRTYITGIFLQAEVKNANGRIYPMNVMREAVERYKAERIDKNQAVGELNHPNPPTPKIDYDRACIKIVSLVEDGTNFIGKALVTNTPKGKLIEGLLSDGVSVGVSSRALAKTVYRNGTVIVQPGMVLATAADVVSDPSAPDAIVSAIMEEREWVMDDNGIVVGLAEDIDKVKGAIRKTKKANLPSMYKKLFEAITK